jgi:glutaconate CoA-transferase subunit B
MTSRGEVADVMVTALAAELDDDDFVGVGLGTPVALVAALVARATRAPGLTILAGGALDVRGGLETFLGGPRTVLGSTPGFVPHFASMDMAERQEMTVQILRPAQVDAAGNLNTSRIGPAEGPDVRFPGGLATGDVPSLLRRVVVYLPDHQLRNFPQKVAFVTGSGRGRSTPGQAATGTAVVVTDLAVIRFGEDGPVVGSVHPWTTFNEVAENTGFELRAAPDLGPTPVPTAAEAAALATIDPERRRDHEIKTRRAHEVPA